MAPVAVSPTLAAQMSTPPLKQLSALNGASDVPPPPAAPKNPARPQRVEDAPARTQFAFDPIEDALAAFGRGEFLVVMDDEGRENEGDLIIAASEVSTEKMAWMIRHTRCASIRPLTGATQITNTLAQWVHMHIAPR